MKRPCSNCGKHQALYRRKGYKRVAARKDHDLCQQCFFAECQRRRIEQMRERGQLREYRLEA